eukprot:14062382-Ditylum_brightwellii.AAC.1
MKKQPPIKTKIRKVVDKEEGGGKKCRKKKNEAATASKKELSLSKTNYVHVKQKTKRDISQ